MVRKSLDFFCFCWFLIQERKIDESPFDEKNADNCSWRKKSMAVIFQVTTAISDVAHIYFYDAELLQFVLLEEKF